MNKLDSRGFSLLAGLLVVLVFGMVGVAGWSVYKNQSKDQNAIETTKQSVNEDPIENDSDLSKVEEELNSTDIDTQLDTTEIDSALAE